MSKSYCVAITGASGFQYGLRLVEQLLQKGNTVHLLLSSAAREVARLECELNVPESAADILKWFTEQIGLNDKQGQLICYDKHDWTSPVASGSATMEAMIVCPCSTGTLAAIATGQSNNLIERAATVTLKEHRKMVIVPREMPLSAIQLEHMHKLALMGVRVLPASPGFYQKPESIADLIDFVVARILQQIDVSHDLLPAWGSKE